MVLIDLGELERCWHHLTSVADTRRRWTTNSFAARAIEQLSAAVILAIVAQIGFVSIHVDDGLEFAVRKFVVLYEGVEDGRTDKVGIL